MKSPFQIFRKHQKVMTVVLIGMAMFAFIFLDTVLGMNEIPPALLVLMLAGVVASLGWIIGTQVGKGKPRRQGKASEFALWGAILGVAVGVVWMRFSGPQPAVQTTAGNLTETELESRIRRRQMANRFIAEAHAASYQPPEQFRSLMSDPRFRGFIEQQLTELQRQDLQRHLFTFGGLAQSPEQEVVLAWLLREEADKMGIAVSDDAVLSYITRATQDRLSKEAYVAIRGRLGLSETELLDILRDEIKAQLALETAFPRHHATPGDLWRQYRQLNFKQQIEAAAVPVSAFTAGVPEPSESELRAFFEQNNHYPWEVAPSEPAFGQPHKVNVAYLEADYEAVEQDVLKSNPVTDEQVREYYAQHRDREYRNAQPQPHPGGRAEGLDRDPFPTGPGGADREAPAEPPKPEAVAPEPKRQPANPRQPESDDSSAASRGVGQSFVAAFDDDETGLDAPQSGSKAGRPIEAPRPEGASPAAAGDGPVEAIKPYRPLDDFLAGEIRDRLLKQRTRAEIAARLEAARKFMQTLQNDYRNSQLDESIGFDARQASDRLAAYAREHGLRYDLTGLIGEEEFSNPEKYPLSAARELRDSLEDLQDPDPFVQPQTGRRVAEVLYTDRRVEADAPAVDLYQVRTAIVPDTKDLYVYWKIADKPAHKPDFDDEGIREQVLAKWKEVQAREQAEQRAKALAEIARKSEKPFQEALSGMALTDGDDARPLTVLPPSEEFSWLTTSNPGSVPPREPPPPRLSQVSIIEKPGREFMEIVWDDLQEGEVGVAPNGDKSIYYVVRVVERTPSSGDAVARAREDFMREELFVDPTGPYAHLRGNEQSRLATEWVQGLFAAYDVRFTMPIEEQP